MPDIDVNQALDPGRVYKLARIHRVTL